MSWKPRNDYVLIRVKPVDQVKGIAMPQTSVQGKEFIVEAIGPDVEDLEVGDKVMPLGQNGVTYYDLPNEKDLITMKQEHVVLIHEPEQFIDGGVS